MTTLPERSALLTDLYQLTMAYGYWQAGRQDDEAVFHLFFRRAPFEGGYAIAAGLADVMDFLDHFAFSPEDLDYLASLTGNDGQALFSADFLAYLRDLRFTGHVHAMPEGSLVFAHEPLIRYQGPLIMGQLLETALLTLVNFPTLIATKASRVCAAAQGDAVLEFGLRRAQGVNGGLAASRAAYLGGCVATSNVLAGQRFGIPVRGTHAHSWVMSYPDEQAAFAAYAQAMPNNCVLLVDTYDTMTGVRRAIEVAQDLRKRGHQLIGIRLDSGDLLTLSVEARRLLNQADLSDAAIVASNDLDEHEITRLKAAGAQINVWGVGTRLATAKDDPALGGVYKLAALRQAGGDWVFKVKLSNDAIKVSNPGILQVRRYQQDGAWLGDLIYHEPTPPQATKFSSFYGPTIHTGEAETTDLLQPIFNAGQRVYTPPALPSSRDFAQAQLQQLPARFRDLTDPADYPVGLEAELAAKKQALIRAWRG